MSMKERRKARREASRAALQTVAAAPSFKAVRKKRTRRSPVRRALLAAAVLTVIATITLATPKAARADLPQSPEIDPTSMAGAMTLLVGGILTLTDRSRRS